MDECLVVCRIKDSQAGIEEFQASMQQLSEQESDIVLRFPTVYIHNCPDGAQYDVYIGESNDILQRTRQHIEASHNADTWQHNVIGKEYSCLYVIGHPHFNKSLTLDIENRFMHYLSSVPAVRQLYNRRGNEQDIYYPSYEMDSIFHQIWNKLQEYDGNLFPDSKKLEDSAIFKASPFHKLTSAQKEDKHKILNIIYSALNRKEKGQLVFVEGEAGTGKTVLNSSLFYDLCSQTVDGTEGGVPKYNCHMIVNHDEQLIVYQQIAAKTGLRSKDEKFISKPTTFINTHSADKPVDIVFVDEAHLLWSQGKQSYRGKNQLEDLRKLSRVLVIMFDGKQQLHTQEYWDPAYIERLRQEAKNRQRDRLMSYYFQLTHQFRIHGNQDTIKWIRLFIDTLQIRPIPEDSQYEIRIFDRVEDLDHEISQRARSQKSRLSRIIATFDWAYVDKKQSSEPDGYWYVKVGNWKKPWNKQIDFGKKYDLSASEKRQLKHQSWPEQKYTIEEVGSTFTIQGFDLNYAGVILGPSIKFRDGKVVIDPSESRDTKATQYRTLPDGSKKKFGEQFIRNEINILMTRGVDGLYIYAVDDELRKALKNAQTFHSSGLIS